MFEMDLKFYKCKGVTYKLNPQFRKVCALTSSRMRREGQREEIAISARQRAEGQFYLEGFLS